jgi:hypothetical protein
MKPPELSPKEWREERVLRICDRLYGWCGQRRRIRHVSGTWWGERLANGIARTYYSIDRR